MIPFVSSVVSSVLKLVCGLFSEFVCERFYDNDDDDDDVDDDKNETV